MKITVFGATGSIGKHVVSQALDSGHIVTAVARDPSKITRSDSRLETIVADVLVNDSRLRNAVAGADAVIIALGDGMRGRVRAAGTKNIIAAMKSVGIKRLICQSTLGAGESFANLNWIWRFIFSVPLRKAMADHQLQERYVRECDFDWTIVRPAAFTDGDRTGQYRHGFDQHARKLTLKIARADVADFMIRQLRESSYLRQASSLSY
ncbi:MAG: NAD(P)-dependent oxidoreductase [Mariniblastus sp.]